MAVFWPGGFGAMGGLTCRRLAAELSWTCWQLAGTLGRRYCYGPWGEEEDDAIVAGEVLSLCRCPGGA